MSDLVKRLRGTLLDKDNFPRMDSEKRFPVGLAKEAAARIEALEAALREIFWHDILTARKIARAALDKDAEQ